MASKKGKDVDDSYWRKIIESSPLDDLMWKVKVVIIETAGSEQDRIYLNKFETYAAEEKRFVIKNISKTETLFMVNQLGGEKKVKDDSVRVFEEGQLYLKDKKPIPSDIMALIIKHLILKMKEEYIFIERQRLLVREGLRRESTTMVDPTEVKGTVCVKPTTPIVEEKVKKGKKDDSTLKSNEPEDGKKYNTQLRVRGEEWRDRVYVDDFPIDGPNLYVAVTGFQDPLLPWCLVKIGIPLIAIVQLRIDVKNSAVPSTLTRTTKRGQSQTELLADKSMKYWENLQKLRIDNETADDFKNTAFIIFTPPYWQNDKLSGDDEKIYDEISFLMYDIQDLSRQHLNYLDNVGLIDIPIDEINADCYWNYHRVLDDFPLECVTVFSILDGILQTVCKNVDPNTESPRTTLSSEMISNIKQTIRSNNNTERAENLIRGVFKKLTCSEVDKKEYRSTYGEEFENYKDPIIIHFGDYCKNTTFHLGNINLDDIVYSTLLSMPVHRLWQHFSKPSMEEEIKINYHVNVLLSCFDRKDVETSELKRLLQLLACRKLYNNRSSNLKEPVLPTTCTEFKKAYLKRSVLAEPLPKCPSFFNQSSSGASCFPSMTKIEEEFIQSISDHELDKIQILFDCPDISELVSAAEIKSNLPIIHMIDNFDYFEDFTGISAFQLLQEVFNKYNCVDYKYCAVTDVIILMFFNSHDNDGIFRNEWRCHLITPVCLQDFFDFILEENYDWIKNQEFIYEDKMEFKRQSEYKEMIDVFATTSCIDHTDLNTELLIEGSLKFQEHQTLEEQSPDYSDMKSVSKKTTIPSPSTLDSKDSKKGKSPTTSTPRKSIIQSLKSGTKFGYSKPFSGYNLGDRRVEALGKDSTYFSKDGTHIYTHYYMLIPMNKEYVSLNIISGNGSNEIKIHRALGDFVNPAYASEHESFRIICKDQVIINVRKTLYQVPIQPVSSTLLENSKSKNKSFQKNSIRSPSHKSSLFIPDLLLETKYFHALNITWPNGLIIESVHENNSSNISHIKQFYVTQLPGLTEDMRCITRAGEVLIFKCSGNIEVLCPDGSYILITKCNKRVIIPEASSVASPASDNSLKKGQKGKGKPSSKPSSKSSKSEEDEHDLKPLEYELHIEEYDIIETSGLRQQFVNEEFVDIEKLLIRTATDHNLGEIFSRRMDGTSILLNYDGVQTVTFKNNTRIISEFFIEENEIYPEWTEDEKEYFAINEDYYDRKNSSKRTSASEKSYSTTSSLSKKTEECKEESSWEDDGFVSIRIVYTIEHPNFATVILDRDTITIVSPNHTSVILKDLNYEIQLDDLTDVSFDGQELQMHYKACMQCSAKDMCKVNICKTDFDNEWWAILKDSLCKKVIVNTEGGLILEDLCCEEVMDSVDLPDIEIENTLDQKTNCAVPLHEHCRDNSPPTLRFFVLHR